MTQDKKGVNTILITGSSQGIGAETARYFGSKGWNVIITYHSNENNARLIVDEIKKSGGDSEAFQLDVTSESSVKKLFKDIENKYHALRVLVNNAGVDWKTPIEGSTFEDWQIITRTKIDGNYLCTKYALPLLRKSTNPQIIVLASNLGDKPDPEDPAYSVGTAGTLAFMKSMSVALCKDGIRTNAVCPSSVRTQSRYWRETNNDDPMWDKMAKDNPLGRNTTTLDVAQTIYTIVSEPSGFWNGNIIFVDGGSRWK